MTDAELPVRYFDREFQVDAVRILPGQYHVSAGRGAITTVLGSCVSTCLWDPMAHIGGMNHFMLPGDATGRGAAWTASARLGVYAMEVLLNEMGKLGADRRRLVAKVFGGARVLAGFDKLDVGAKNAEFVLGFLKTEGIPLAAQDLQDVHPRKIYFFPETGKVQVKRLKLTPTDTVRREREYFKQLSQAGGGGDIEIFSPPP